MNDPNRTTPPDGYVECRDKCGNWTGVVSRCWGCITKLDPSDGAARLAKSTLYPDWTPPLPVAPATPVQPKVGPPKGVHFVSWAELELQSSPPHAIHPLYWNSWDFAAVCPRPDPRLSMTMDGAHNWARIARCGHPLYAEAVTTAEAIRIVDGLKQSHELACTECASVSPKSGGAKAQLCCNRMMPGCTCEVCGRSTPSASGEPAASTPVPAPKCYECEATDKPMAMRYVGKRPARLWCDPCYLMEEGGATHYRDAGGYEPTNILHNPDVPERLTRAKLAHQGGLHDDDLLFGEGTAR